MNFQFEFWPALLLLAVVPVMVALLLVPKLARRRTQSVRFTGVSQLSAQTRGWKRYLDPLPEILTIISLTLCIFALARPQLVEPEEVEVEGIDIFLALDMSGSMRAIDQTQDEVCSLNRMGKDLLTRFEAAVHTLQEFVSTRDYDRIGMVVFAKDAFLQFPLTLDRRTIISMLDSLKLGDIDEGGTAIGNAMGRGISGLKDSDARTKILILITDGDRRGGNISPKQATTMAKSLGIKVYPILVGRKGPTLVPAGRDPFTGTIVYRETEFPVNPELLKEIADGTSGRYFHAADAETLKRDLHEILNEFERSRIRDTTSVDPEELFRPLLLWALAALVLAFLLRHTFLRRFP